MQTEGTPTGVEARRVCCLELAWTLRLWSPTNQSQQGEDIIRQCFLQIPLLAAPRRKNRRGSKARKQFGRQLHSIPISSAWCIKQSQIQLNEYRRLFREGTDGKAVLGLHRLTGWMRRGWERERCDWWQWRCTPWTHPPQKNLCIQLQNRKPRQAEQWTGISTYCISQRQFSEVFVDPDSRNTAEVNT